MTLTRLSPENFDVANAWLQYGNVQDTARALAIPEHVVVSTLKDKQIKAYLDGVYLDMGYRNRHKLGALLDRMIDQKIEEAEESGVFTGKDLYDLIALAHKMRMDEIKAEKAENSTTVNVANFGEGNYGKLMGKLLEGKGNG
jgi:hypothetical protein